MITDLEQNNMRTSVPPGPAKHVDLTQRIIGVFYDVYNELGPGFLESVYREAMRLALTEANLAVTTEVPIPVHFRGAVIGIFRADLVVNGTVLIELKTCDAIAREHASQVLNYLKATQLEVALLMNFGPTPRLKRFVMDNETKKSKPKSVSSASICVKPFGGVEVHVAGAEVLA
jgi:GxxExxY protein